MAPRQTASALSVGNAARPDAALLLRVSGPDHPGITADLMALLGVAEVDVQDVEQVLVRGHLTLAVAVADPGDGGTALAAVLEQLTRRHDVTVSVVPAPAPPLISDPVDGATIARTWVSQGGVQKFLLNDGMNSDDFINAVGKEYLADAFGTSSGTDPTASTKYFNANYKEFSGIDPAAPAADRSYDAGALVGLAIAIAGGPDAAKLPDALRKAVDPAGEPIHAGKEEFAKALKLIAEGKPIRYEGVIGPVNFDEFGDISGPFRLWQIVDGKVTTVGEMSTADVEAIKASIK